MSRRNPLRLRIASPCKADWDAMRGDDAVRHCGACDKHVYNLSEMTTTQVEALLREAGETPCVRFYQRHDGTVMTGDCPIGARSRRRVQTLAGLGAGALAAFGLAVSPSVASGGEEAPLMGAVPGPETVTEFANDKNDDIIVEPLVGPFAKPPPRDEMLMGRMVLGEPALVPDDER
jgi:hypothetical protein